MGDQNQIETKPEPEPHRNKRGTAHIAMVDIQQATWVLTICKLHRNSVSSLFSRCTRHWEAKGSSFSSLLMLQTIMKLKLQVLDLSLWFLQLLLEIIILHLQLWGRRNMQIILLLNALQIIALKLLLKAIHLQTEISHNDPLSKNKSNSSKNKLNIETASSKVRI